MVVFFFSHSIVLSFVLTHCVDVFCRRFSYAPLAQLKFLLPNVIEIKKVLIHDERTSCMKPDLHVTLNIDAIKDEGQLKSTSWNSQMRNVFRARLLDFVKAHPEVYKLFTCYKYFNWGCQNVFAAALRVYGFFFVVLNSMVLDTD